MNLIIFQIKSNIHRHFLYTDICYLLRSGLIIIFYYSFKRCTRGANYHISIPQIKYSCGFLITAFYPAVADEQNSNHKNLLSRKATKCPVLRHLDYRLGRGIRKIPDCASTSGTLLIASRILQTIPVFLFFLPNSTLFPKWGKIRQITSLIRSKIVVKIGVSYYSP